MRANWRAGALARQAWVAVAVAVAVGCGMSARAGEWSFTVANGVPGQIGQNSLYELFLPDTPPKPAPLRGLLAVFNYEGGAQMYSDPRVRSWAARENLGIIRHRVRNTDSQLTIAKTQPAVDMMFGQALPALAAACGRPEVADASLIWSGLSQAGWAAVELANLSPGRTLAVLPIHDSAGARDPGLAGSLDGLGVPTLHVIGASDNVNGGTLASGTLYAQTIMGFAQTRRANGALNAVVVQRNAGHTHWAGRTDTDLSFMLDWAAAAVDRQVPESGSGTVPARLFPISEESGFLGSLGVSFAQSNPFIRVTSATAEAYEAAGARGKWWLPTSSIGEAWQDYNLSGAYVIVPEPSGAMMAWAAMVMVLVRRR